MGAIIAIAIAVVALYYCTGGNHVTDRIFGPPDVLPFSRYDDLDVNVYFYFPSGTEVYLGKVRGASACGDAAHGFAYREELTRNREWSYVCCTVEAGSDCYRKIR